MFAAVGFYFFEADDGIGELVRDWYHADMTGYEFPQLTMLRDHYADFWFPYDELENPGFTMTASWSYHQLAAFLHQWIVVKRAREAGTNALTELLPQIAERWPGSGETSLEIRWPLFVRAARLGT